MGFVPDPQPVASGRFVPDAPPDSTGIERAINDIAGAGEAAIGYGRGIFRTAATGLGGLGALAAKHPALKLLGVKPPDVSDVMERIQKIIPEYEPSTAKGREFTEALSVPGQAIRSAGQRVGDVYERLGYGPATSAFVSLAPDVAATTTGSDLIGRPKPRDVVRRKIAEQVSTPPKNPGRVVQELVDLVAPGGAERIATRYQRKLVGEPEDLQVIAQALRGAKEIIPGSRPTASQVTSQIPAASPLVAHERVVASAPGGPSKLFGVRKLEQERARVQARELRDAITTPMREAALEAANRNGVQSKVVLDRLQKMQQVPGQRASTVVSKSLADLRDRVGKHTDLNGKIDARDLYTIRKELGSLIETNAKENANWDKKLTSGLQRDMQLVIDDAIESAGGTGWKNYLHEFASRSKQIDADIERAEAVKTPPQKTNLSAAPEVVEQSRVHLPNLLSRPAMLANAALRMMGHKVEPKVTKVMATRYLNPQELATALTGKPQGPVEMPYAFGVGRPLKQPPTPPPGRLLPAPSAPPDFTGGPSGVGRPGQTPPPPPPAPKRIEFDPFSQIPSRPARPQLSAQSTLTERLADPDMKAELLRMKWQTGQEVKGGQIYRNIKGEVIGRTSHLPGSLWWRDRPTTLTAAETRNAIDKAVNGQKLTKRETTMIQYMTDYAMGIETSDRPPVASPE